MDRISNYRQVTVVLTPHTTGERISVAVIARTVTQGRRSDHMLFRGHLDTESDMDTVADLLRSTGLVLSQTADRL